MSECYKQLYIYNSELLDASSFDDSVLDKENIVYEVIRVINGKAFKLEDNYNRIIKSLALAELDYRINLEHMAKEIENLIVNNKVIEGNIKYLIYKEDDKLSSMIFFIRHYYPTNDQKLNGVNTLSLHAEREKPNAKVVNKSLRSRANSIIAKENVFEVILIDSKGYATEGSRSNLFFVKDSVVYTASDDSVLKGTARKRAIEICNNKNISLVREKVSELDFVNFDAAFLTGTSLGILPIAKIDNIEFDVTNKIMKDLQKAYHNLLVNI